jgi:hypothetical protein
MNLMDLFVKVAYDDKDVDKGIEGTSKKGKGFAKTLSAAFKGTAAVVGAISTAAIALGGAFVKGAMDVSDYGSEVNDMSQKLNMSAQGFQEWRYILGQSSVDIGVLQGGMKKLSESAVAGSESFKTLGISQEELSSLSTEELFNITIAQLSEMEAGNERTALAADLFGRSATELLPILNEGADGLEKMRKQAEDYGLVMSDESVKASDDFGDSVSLMQQTLTGMKNRMMSEFLPSLTLVTDGLAKLFTGDTSGLDSINDGISGFVDKIAQAIPQIIEVGGSIIQSLVSALMQNMPLLVTAAFDLISQFAGFVLENLPMLIETALSILTTLALGIAEQAPTLIPAIVQTMLTIVQTLINNIPLLVDAAIQLVMGLVQGLIAAIPLLISAIPTLITSFIEAITTAVPMLVEAAIAIVLGLVDGIVAAIPLLVEMIPQLITSLINAIVGAIPMIVQAAPQIIIGLINGIVSAIPMLVGMIPQLIQSVVSGIIANLPMLITAAIQMVIQLAVGLVQAIPELIKAIPQLIVALVEGFGSMLGELGTIGLNLVKGIFDGISNAVSWLYDKLKGWVSGVLSYIKNLFGIKSPSTVMRDEVGKYLSMGLGDGIMKYAGYATDAMSSLMNGIMDETYNPVINPTVNGSAGLYGDALASAGGMGGVSIGQVNFNQPLQSTTQAAKLFGRKLVGELYA